MISSIDMQSIMDRIKDLIVAAQRVAPYELLAGQDIESYLNKLHDSAEIFTWGKDGRVGGFIAFYCNDKCRTAAFITMIVVDPEFRGLGIGQALVEAVLAAARARAFKTCRLQVHKNNHAANKLYDRLGFHVISMESDYLAMERQL